MPLGLAFETWDPPSRGPIESGPHFRQQPSHPFCRVFKPQPSHVESRRFLHVVVQSVRRRRVPQSLFPTFEMQFRSESLLPGRDSQVTETPRESGELSPGQSPISTTAKGAGSAAPIASPMATRPCSTRHTGANSPTANLRTRSLASDAAHASLRPAPESPSAITKTTS